MQQESSPLITLSIIHFSLKDGFSLREHLEPFFESILSQTYRHIEIYCVDNASTDEEAKEYLRNLSDRGVQTIFLDKNRGTCAHNAVLPLAKGKYFWCLTMDTRYDPTFLERLVEEAERRPRGGAFGGALLSFGGKETPDHIDSLGTSINIWSSFAERGNGMLYEGQKLPPVEEVFGISGATVLYRMDALRDIMFADQTVWDEGFMMYYEDVDVCYRMQRRDWQSYLVHAAKGYHVRTLKERKVFGGRVARILRSRKIKSQAGKKVSSSVFYRALPTRNKLWLLMRNHSAAYSPIVHIATALEVLGRIAYIIVFERDLLTAVREAWEGRKLLEKQAAVPSEKVAAQRIERLMHS